MLIENLTHPPSLLGCQLPLSVWHPDCRLFLLFILRQSFLSVCFNLFSSPEHYVFIVSFYYCPVMLHPLLGQTDMEPEYLYSYQSTVFSVLTGTQFSVLRQNYEFIYSYLIKYSCNMASTYEYFTSTYECFLFSIYIYIVKCFLENQESIKIVIIQVSKIIRYLCRNQFVNAFLLLKK